MRALVLVLSAALILAACGESEQDKAQKRVCSARADIGKRVNELKALTPATATVDGVRARVDAIQEDLRKIVDAQDALNGDRRAKVKAATDRFTARVASLVQQAASSLSLRDAATRLRAAAGDLATAYAGSLGRIDC
jgi:Tfp pilus assembly protein PilP